jgi:hypothetical protein
LAFGRLIVARGGLAVNPPPLLDKNKATTNFDYIELLGKKYRF